MMQVRFRFILVLFVAVMLSGTRLSFSQAEDETPPPDFVEFEKAPEIIKTVTPRYPELARRAGMEGTVFVRVWVDREGKPRTVEIQKSGAEIFNQPAIEAAEQMRFSPAMKDGKPVSVWVAMPFKFKLTGRPALRDTTHTTVVSDSMRAVVEKLLEVMDIENLFTQTMDQMLALQIQQKPELLPLEATLRAFLNKYMSWQSLKADVVQMYAEAFTVNEVQALTDFYQSPVGQKALKRVPALMMRGGQIGAQRVQDNRAELERMIQEALNAEQEQ